MATPGNVVAIGVIAFIAIALGTHSHLVLMTASSYCLGTIFVYSVLPQATIAQGVRRWAVHLSNNPTQLHAGSFAVYKFNQYLSWTSMRHPDRCLTWAERV